MSIRSRLERLERDHELTSVRMWVARGPWDEPEGWQQTLGIEAKPRDTVVYIRKGPEAALELLHGVALTD